MCIYGRNYIAPEELERTAPKRESPVKKRPAINPGEVKVDHILDCLGDMKNSKEAFKFFDKNNNGIISKNELKLALDKLSKEIIARAKGANDGENI